MRFDPSGKPWSSACPLTQGHKPQPHLGPTGVPIGLTMDRRTDRQTDGPLRFAAARALGYASPKTTSCARSPEGVFLGFPGAQRHAATAPAPSGGTSPLSPHRAVSQLGRGQQGTCWWARGVCRAQSLWVCTTANPRAHPGDFAPRLIPAHTLGDFASQIIPALALGSLHHG